MSHVPHELAHRFGRAKDKLAASVGVNDAASAVGHIENVIRGWAKVEAEAVAAGISPLAPDGLGRLYNGREFFVVLDSESFDAASQRAPQGVLAVSLDELLAAYEIVRQKIALDAIKEAFPGATLQPPRPKLDERVGDEVPF